MRVTVELAEDVLTEAQAYMGRTGSTLDQALNDILLVGIKAIHLDEQTPFVIHPRPLGLLPELHEKSMGELLEIAEGPLYK